ncbi:helix-turn-helix transcriptional regulator [Alicyclobacillus tolerans]|uniref:helix-turn-helix domain-containing protein n=1 Tax=Alicyclobacillus tolerans TaxID=90970 RepID=UPI001F1C8FF8|nr:helix-turn-helix transcriptional regulator [Alicyclobacillus tolerans]MCF8567711.1 helix-turn-helix transcriptional regulator [Alicyclobacillus tolerans]
MFGVIRTTQQKPGRKLRVIMADLDVNVQELAYMSGVSEATITRIRNGRIDRPRIDTAIALCEVLGVHLEDVFTGLY